MSLAFDDASSIFTDRETAWEYYERYREFERTGNRICTFINARSRGGQACPYCARIMRTHDEQGHPVSSKSALYPTRDHIVPRFQCGEDIRDNIAIVCRSCNEMKDDFTVIAWRDLLLADSDPQAGILTALIENDPRRFGRTGSIGMRVSGASP